MPFGTDILAAPTVTLNLHEDFPHQYRFNNAAGYYNYGK
jgi:hypothetical protein